MAISDYLKNRITIFIAGILIGAIIGVSGALLYQEYLDKNLEISEEEAQKQKDAEIKKQLEEMDALRKSFESDKSAVTTESAEEKTKRQLDELDKLREANKN